VQGDLAPHVAHAPPKLEGPLDLGAERFMSRNIERGMEGGRGMERDTERGREGGGGRERVCVRECV